MYQGCRTFISHTTSILNSVLLFHGLSMLRPASKFAQGSGPHLPRWFCSSSTISQVLKQKPSTPHGLSSKSDRQAQIQEATEEIRTRAKQDMPPRHGRLFLLRSSYVTLLLKSTASLIFRTLLSSSSFLPI